MDKLLKLKEAAQILHYTPDTVKNLIKKGKLPGGRVGWGWRIRESDLQEFINARTQKTS